MSNSTNSRIVEILSMLGVIVLAVFAIFIEWWLFSSGKIVLTDVRPKQWAIASFTPAALIVFSISTIAAFLWYVMAVKISRHFSPKEDTIPSMLKWFIFLFFPVAGICGVLYFYGQKSTQALPYLAIFLTIDGVLLYWLATALSTPSIMAHVVPLAFQVRSLGRRK